MASSNWATAACSSALRASPAADFALARVATLATRMALCTIGSRSPSMNMCSVRQRPMPTAPYERALVACSGVSALAQTPMRRISSAQPRIVWSSGWSSKRASTVGRAPAYTMPVEPSTLIQSPSAKLVPVRLDLALLVP